MSRTALKVFGNISYFDATKAFKDPATGEKLPIGDTTEKEADNPRRWRGTGLKPASAEQLSSLAEKFAK